MNTKIKAAFFDIDGTLVSFNTHCVPQSAKQALNLLRQNGVRCFISSGRHISNINNLPGLTFDGYITVNGGMTYCNGTLIDSNPIDKKDVKTMLDMIYEENRFPSCFVRQDGLLLSHETAATDQIFRQLRFDPMPPIADLRTLTDEPIYQMITFFGPDIESEIMQRLPSCASERWSPVFTDVVPRGQSKVRGIEKICNKLSILPSEIVAFGDGGNDIDMLRYAGIGVAMGGAEELVKSAADIVAPDVDKDGIWHVVQNILND